MVTKSKLSMSNRVSVKHANFLEKQREKLQKPDEGSHQKKKKTEHQAGQEHYYSCFEEHLRKNCITYQIKG